MEDYFHEELTRISGAPIQFDIFLPTKNIALEYHGVHHFNELPSFGNLELYQKRDLEKQKLCKEQNITLIVIPYSQSPESITILIQKTINNIDGMEKSL